MGAIKGVCFLLYLDSPKLLLYVFPTDYTCESNNIITVLKLFIILIVSLKNKLCLEEPNTNLCLLEME